MQPEETVTDTDTSKKVTEIAQLKEKARHMRKSVLDMIFKAKSGHPGGSLSASDLMVGLFYHKMRYKVEDPLWKDRDRFIMSKGHACPIHYAILADLGFIPKEELNKLRTLEGNLEGHPSCSKTNGVEISTGSLGMGLSAGNGMALSAKLDHKDYKTYVLIGDGEVQEGQIWEAIMTADSLKLNNVVAIFDCNDGQNDAKVSETLEIQPLAPKLRAFNWEVVEIDGHNMEEIVNALDQADKSEKPFAIIARTEKGKGVSFMEGNMGFHGKAPTEEELTQAYKELGF